MEKLPKLTALIIVLNGERVLASCLESLSFCDNIVVIDSYSTDNTKKITLEHNAIFVENKFEGYMEQIQFGLKWIEENLPSDWIFFLDCDEICSLELKQSIQETLAKKDYSTSAYQVARRTWYYDKFVTHGGMYPDRLFRLFTQKGITISQKNGHPIYTPTGKHALLEGDLLHYSYSSFSNQMEKLNSYATRGAVSMQNAGKSKGLFSALFHAKWRFFHMYIIKLGFLDGKAGFLLAFHVAFYTFLKYIRTQEGDWGKPYVYSLKELDNNISQKNKEEK